MPRPKLVGPLSLALTAYDLYRRLPPRQRKQVLDLARKHGPRLAASAYKGAYKAYSSRGGGGTSRFRRS